MKKVILIAIIAISTVASTVFAADPPKAGQQPIADFQAACPATKLTLATGQAEGTYAKVMGDVTKVCPTTCNYATQGGLDNVIGLAHNDFDLGLVQVDTLESMGAREQHVKDLRSLLSLYPAALHILTVKSGAVIPNGNWLWDKNTTKTFATIGALKGQRIAVWSSAEVTARNVNAALSLGMDLVSVSTVAEGLDKLNKHNVVAFMGMGAAPLGWVDKEENRGKYTLVLMTQQDIDNVSKTFSRSGYTPVTFGTKFLDQQGVLTIGSVVELVSQDFQGSQSSLVQAYRSCIVNNFANIKETRGAQPVWKLTNANAIQQTRWTAYKDPDAARTTTSASPSAKK